MSEDVKNEDLTGNDLVAELCYGKAKSEEYKESGKVIVDRLRSEHLVKREDLAEELGLDLSVDKESKKFQRIIGGLTNKNNGGLYACVRSRRKNGNTYYFLDRGKFDEIQDRITQNVRYNISTKPREEVRELRRKNQQLKEEVQRLRDRVEEDEIGGEF